MIEEIMTGKDKFFSDLKKEFGENKTLVFFNKRGKFIGGVPIEDDRSDDWEYSITRVLEIDLKDESFLVEDEVKELDEDEPTFEKYRITKDSINILQVVAIVFAETQYEIRVK
jgi:hypothetical protein